VSAVGVVAALSALGALGVLLVVSGSIQPAPTLVRTLERLSRPPDEAGTGPSGAGSPPVARLLHPVVTLLRGQPRVLPSRTELALVGRSLDQHALWLVLAAVAGLVGPTLVLGLLQATGVVGLRWYVPVVVALGGAVLGPLLVHTATVERASAVRSDLRYQVSAYLDVVTMLLAGNTGYEGALDQAAHAGDGRLFVELRRRMRESGARGTSLTDALHLAGRDLGLDELEQVAATAALSAAEGAPVARTLAAKCATLRSALASEQETEARLRTSRLTTPIVGMALIFMGLVIYPALSFP
jgi:Flp pilus assembly protein TadB